VQAEKQVALEDGAFTVVPELEGCSAVPSTMLLGAANRVTVTFTLQAGLGPVQFDARPFVLRLKAPGVFPVAPSAAIVPLRNLPPALCGVPSPQELSCELPEGFTFMPGATYAFQATVTNPVVSTSHDELHDRYTPGWALELFYSEGSSPLYMLCEDIPKSPLRDNVSDLSYDQPFPLYTAESQRLFFVVDVNPAELLPYSVSGATSEVGIAEICYS